MKEADAKEIRIEGKFQEIFNYPIEYEIVISNWPQF